ncbi:MAG: selenite/tellurite reduction operon protein ExtJ [Desulforhopalus sp.]
MNKKIVSFAVAMVFALSAASVSFAAKVKCTVDSVEGDTVTMTCEKADKMKKGDNVKVSVKSGAAIEGC